VAFIASSSATALRPMGTSSRAVDATSDRRLAACWGDLMTWEKHVLSARRFTRVGRHSEYAI
jgi:hypothetical protein